MTIRFARQPVRLCSPWVLTALLVGCASQLDSGDAIDGTATMVGPTEATACDAATMTATSDAHRTRPLDDTDDFVVVETSACRCAQIRAGGWNCAVDYRIGD